MSAAYFEKEQLALCLVQLFTKWYFYKHEIIFKKCPKIFILHCVTSFLNMHLYICTGMKIYHWCRIMFKGVSMLHCNRLKYSTFVLLHGHLIGPMQREGPHIKKI